jgi:plasmid stabilization system protein ParE
VRVVFTPQARAEYTEVVEWYEQQIPGLGKRLRADFSATRARLTTNPRQFPFALRDVRRASLRHFPYIVMFRAAADTVQIIAFFHMSRDPQHWQRRI